MNSSRFLACIASWLLLVHTAAAASPAAALTYSGRLTDGGTPATGVYDFNFQLFTLEQGGVLVGQPVTKDNVGVTNGLFTVDLDFGPGAFTGAAGWLQISVRPGASLANFVPLTPRQPLATTPYAVYAPTAGSVPWSSITGIPAGFADGLDDNTTYTAGAGLLLTGTVFSIPTAGVLNSMLAPQAVTGDKVAPLAITGDKLASLTVTGDKIAQAAITGDKIAPQAITSVKIADKQVVRSLNSLFDDIDLVPGDNILITPIANLLQISAPDLWKTKGNSGLTSANFLGTLDVQNVEFRVANSHALRLEPAGSGPNLIGGVRANFAGTNTSGSVRVANAVIGGGGTAAAPNQVTDDFGVVGGGFGNQAGNNDDNPFDGRFASVGGGQINLAAGESSRVGGGAHNSALGELTTIAGGGYNSALGYAATVGGGGGIDLGLGTPVPNVAYGYWNTIGGGSHNLTTNGFATVGGGSRNQAAGAFSTVGGGANNQVSGDYSTVAGGQLNGAAGDHSFAGGYHAKAEASGSFAWADASSATDFVSANANEFAVRATGGARFVSDTSGHGVQLPAGGGAWSSLSDRNAKANFAAVNGRDVLERLATVPMQTWNYQGQATSIRHLGPTAQDFASAFGLGEDERHISTVDADGVALSAIQGLYQLVREDRQSLAEKEKQLRERDEQLRKQAATLAELQARLSAMEKLISALPNSQPNDR